MVGVEMVLSLSLSLSLSLCIGVSVVRADVVYVIAHRAGSRVGDLRLWVVAVNLLVNLSELCLLHCQRLEFLYDAVAPFVRWPFFRQEESSEELLFFVQFPALSESVGCGAGQFLKSLSAGRWTRVYERDKRSGQKGSKTLLGHPVTIELERTFFHSLRFVAASFQKQLTYKYRSVVLGNSLLLDYRQNLLLVRNELEKNQ
ncbi:hypothetical protein K501DRAFT_271645 [Backusella circina FSU 941]|nr:hypothetical protein K501DRAFT_271645 [Backusella circina FSU 941]